MTIEGTETREEIEESLGHLTHSAKRCFQVVGVGDFQTGWDRLHERIDAQLDAREMAGLEAIEFPVTTPEEN